MCIAVPDTCILAESNQLIKYSSPSNSQSEALKQKLNTLSLSVMQHIGWLFLVGVACQTKMFILQGLLHPQVLDGVL